jgi:RNA polymerase sigma-70 factor (ECF subfamily)
MAKESDQELIQLAREGDNQAFGELVRRHQKRIFRLAVHMLRDTTEAEDVTQETFVRAYQALARFQGNSQPYTWLYRIAVNLSLNIIRTRKPRQHVTGDDDPRIESWLAVHAPSGEKDPATVNEQRELAKALCEGIDQLSDTLRTTLLLVAMDGLGHAEASEVLGCPEGTVAWRVHEARRKLRSHLSGLGFVDEKEGEP